MNLFIGVMAMCMAQDEICVANTTAAMFANEGQCQEHMEKHYKGKNISCIKAQVFQAETKKTKPIEIAPIVEEITMPEDEEETNTVTIMREKMDGMSYSYQNQ